MGGDKDKIFDKINFWYQKMNFGCPKNEFWISKNEFRILEIQLDFPIPEDEFFKYRKMNFG